VKRSKSSRSWFLRIEDILNSIEKIEEYTKNMTLAEFTKNQLIIDAVVRNFEILGEASKHIPLSVQKSYPHIPWKQMVEMRNFLIHEYTGVDISTVWQTARNHLPTLKKQLSTIPLVSID
jgi:uncharacterized protein with HEPN domain